MEDPASTEAERLAALTALRVLDTAPERVFDGLVEAAALVCGVPISLVSLVDVDRQWFKAKIGLEDISETPREHAFCSVAIRDDELLEIPDATLDSRFRDNPMVVGEPGIRFYAGAPLRVADGSRVGTLCVIDRAARMLDPTQRSVLRHLAAAAARALETRRMAIALEASEARFRALSEAAPLGVFETDRASACTYANARWCAIFGLDEVGANGRRWIRDVHPDEREAVALEWRRATELALDFDREFRVLRSDGVVRHVRMLSRPVPGDGTAATMHVGSVEDVTERKAQELALRKGEALLEATAVLADVGGWELDLQRDVLTWSDQTCRIHGVEPGYRPRLDEAIEFYAPAARSLVRDAVRSGIVDGRGWDLELPFVRADGKRRWVRAVGRAEREDGKAVVRLLGAFQDVTDRVLQRRALERAHERMMLATESGRIGIWDWDIRRGTADWTPQMYPLLGLPAGPERVVGDSWTERVHPEDRDALRQLVRGALDGADSLDAEFRVVHDDGRVRHLCVAARLTRETNGEAVRMLGAIWDVTPLRDLSNELAGQHELLHVTLQSITDAVVTADAEARVTWLNPAAEQLTGWRSADAAGVPMSRVCPIVHEETRQPLADPAAACVREGIEVCSTEPSVLLSRTGKSLGIEHSAAPIRKANDQLLGAVFVFRDVSEQRRLSREMSHRATHDALTGLVNRAEFETRLERALTRACEQGAEHALMYIDLDRFKLVNDTCGHVAGDQLLQQVSKLMSTVMRSRDTLARIGGDEFAVILENCSSDQARRTAQDIRDRLNEFRFVHGGQQFRIGASIGLVPIDRRWSDIAIAMQAADVSCYSAKRAGRNRVHSSFDTDRGLSKRRREVEWVARLEQALEENRFVLYAQRIDSASEPVDGLHAEILIRLRDDDDRLIQPGAFLPAAERFHLATRIDLWVLRHVVERLESIPDLAVASTLCVNISGQSIGDREFHHEAIETLTRAGGEICRRLCLEITETAAITDMTNAVDFAEQVRSLGVRIALDDFGAGASSFGYLRSLPVDVLKIDGRYIRNMIDDALDDAAVRCFVDIARLTGAKTVAEYVDRPEVLTRVREVGIDYVQGFLLHEPEPIESLLESVERSVLPAHEIAC